MRTLFLTLHVVAAVFLIGPLVAAVNQAPRLLRAADAGGLRVVSRTVTIYGWASLAVLVFGAAVAKDDYEAWLIVALVLFLLATALLLGLLAPLLRNATTGASDESDTGTLAGRAAMLGGIISLLYVIVTVLMAWQPGD